VSPATNPNVLACKAALQEIRRFDTESTNAYQHANDLTDNASYTQRVRVYRQTGAKLYAIELQLATLDIPDELAALYELEQQYVNSARRAYERAAAALSGNPSASTNAVIQQLAARGNELHDVVYDRIQAFRPRACA
jgi:hypothetical protein